MKNQYLTDLVVLYFVQGYSKKGSLRTSSKTLIWFEDGTKTLISKPPGSIQLKLRIAEFVGGWSKNAAFVSAEVRSSKVENRFELGFEWSF